MKANIKKNIIHFWLDHLEIFANCRHEAQLFDPLDFDNSNVWELEEYIYFKTEVLNYSYKIMFMYEWYPVFAFYKWDTKANIPTKDYLIVHGSAFKLMEEKDIRYFIEWYFENISHLRRFDICFDTPYFIMEILKYFPHYKWKGASFYDENWDTATQYFWEKQKGKNKRSIIRVYNKILDIVQSKKVKLFKDYLKFDALTRVELEIRPELAKNVSYEDIWKREVQQAIFKNYISRRTKLFDFLPVEKLSLFKKKEIDLDSEEYQGFYYKTQRKGIFLWHAKAIYNLWFCPVRVLIEEWYLQPKTTSILWIFAVDQITLMEKKIKEEFFLKKQKRRDFQNLLDNSPEYEWNGE